MYTFFIVLYYVGTILCMHNNNYNYYHIYIVLDESVNNNLCSFNYTVRPICALINHRDNSKKK